MRRRGQDRRRRRMWIAIATGALVSGAAIGAGARLAKGRDREPALEPPLDATP